MQAVYCTEGLGYEHHWPIKPEYDWEQLSLQVYDRKQMLASSNILYHFMNFHQENEIWWLPRRAANLYIQTKTFVYYADFFLAYITEDLHL